MLKRKGKTLDTRYLGHGQGYTVIVPVASVELIIWPYKHGFVVLLFSFPRGERSVADIGLTFYLESSLNLFNLFILLFIFLLQIGEHQRRDLHSVDSI